MIKPRVFAIRNFTIQQPNDHEDQETKTNDTDSPKRQASRHGESTATHLMVSSPTVRLVSCIEFTHQVFQTHKLFRTADFDANDLIHRAEAHTQLFSISGHINFSSSVSKVVSQLRTTNSVYYKRSCKVVSLGECTLFAGKRISNITVQSHQQVTFESLAVLLDKISQARQLQVNAGNQEVLGQTVAAILRCGLESVVLMRQVNGTALVFDPQTRLNVSTCTGLAGRRGVTLSYFESMNSAVHRLHEIFSNIVSLEETGSKPSEALQLIGFGGTLGPQPEYWSVENWTNRIVIDILLPSKPASGTNMKNVDSGVDPFVQNAIDFFWPKQTESVSRVSNVVDVSTVVLENLDRLFRGVPIPKLLHFKRFHTCSSLALALLECVHQLPLVWVSLYPISLSVFSRSGRANLIGSPCASTLRSGLLELYASNNEGSPTAAYQVIARLLLGCDHEAYSVSKTFSNVIRQLDYLDTELPCVDDTQMMQPIGSLFQTVTLRKETKRKLATKRNLGALHKTKQQDINSFKGNQGATKNVCSMNVLEISVLDILRHDSGVDDNLCGKTSLEKAIESVARSNIEAVTNDVPSAIPLTDLPCTSYFVTQCSSPGMQERMKQCMFDVDYVDDEAVLCLQFQKVLETWSKTMPMCSVLETIPFPSPFYMYFVTSPYLAANNETVIQHELDQIPICKRVFDRCQSRSTSKLDETGNLQENGLKFCNRSAYTELVILWMMIAASSTLPPRDQSFTATSNYRELLCMTLEQLPRSTSKLLQQYVRELKQVGALIPRNISRSDSSIVQHVRNKSSWSSSLIHVGCRSDILLHLLRMASPNLTTVTLDPEQVDYFVQRIALHHYNLLLTHSKISSGDDKSCNSCTTDLQYAPVYFTISLDWDTKEPNATTEKQSTNRIPRLSEISQVFHALEDHLTQIKLLSFSRVFQNLGDKTSCVEHPQAQHENWVLIMKRARLARRPIEVLDILLQAFIHQVKEIDQGDVDELICIVDQVFNSCFDQGSDDKHPMYQPAQDILKAICSFRAHVKLEQQMLQPSSYAPAIMVLNTPATRKGLKNKYSLCISRGEASNTKWELFEPYSASKSRYFTWQTLVSTCIQNNSYPILVVFQRNAVRKALGAFDYQRGCPATSNSSNLHSDALSFAQVDEAVEWAQNAVPSLASVEQRPSSGETSDHQIGCVVC